MDRYTNECIDGAKDIIQKQLSKNRIHLFGIRFSEFQKSYFWTNENIKEYFKLLDLKYKQSALSVMASGDHTFNLITYGILNIDTFDTNKLTEYFALGLKKAMILKYNYQDFINLYTKISTKEIDNNEILEIIFDLLPYMDEKYRLFWKEIIDYTYKCQCEYDNNINLIYLLYMGIRNELIKNNNYLQDEESYNLLRNNLGKANINFKYANALNLNREFSSKYDVLLLSNILDYFYSFLGNNWEYYELQEYESRIEQLINNNGVIVLHYIMMFGSSRFTSDKLFDNSGIVKDDLTDEEVYKVNRKDSNKVYDGIILKRVK